MKHLKQNPTKAETLKFLQNYKKKINIKIPEFIFFTKKEYLKNKLVIFNKIKKKFGIKKIIVRSSSKQEDTIEYSNAGKYKSFKNLKVNKEIVLCKIDEVIKDFNNINDQILIQEFISNPSLSGVIFTKNINNNSPYYFINFDKSGYTDLITSGKINPSMKNIIVKRNKTYNNFFLKKYLTNIKKIEKIFSNERLDIEFCIKNKKFYLFQCRPLKTMPKVNENKLDEVLVNVTKKINKLQTRLPNLPGNISYFSNMTDWNPAEMIGVRPTPLSLSLYTELITDEVWAEQRSNYGYRDVRPNRLMINLAGSPYIDLRVDFNSFLPADLPKKIQEKSINFYLSKIKNKNYLQDKVEFDLIETCYDFNSKNSLKKFLSKKEVGIYLKCLRRLSNTIMGKNSNVLNSEIEKIKTLKTKIEILKRSKLSEIQKIYYFLQDCKKFGTLSFAGIARCAFMSTKILRSLVKMKIISMKDLENFYASISTITKEMNDSLNKINSNKKRMYFLEKYGHLRPSTYSISSKNYKENFNKYFSKNFRTSKSSNKKFKLNKSQIKKINKTFFKHRLNFNTRDFFEFAKKSIYFREYSKLIFTKSINEIFKNLIKLSKTIKIPRNDLEYVSIKSFLNFYSNVDVQKLKKIIINEIENNKSNADMLNLIEFPEFILNNKSFYLFEQKSKQGNYVTTKTTHGKIINFKKINNYALIKNKIVFLENADPGYDFIFSHGIKGLVTEYGGANSHMSIRCLELGIPAIIGIGAKEYYSILKNNNIEINCNQKNYKILN